MRFNKIKLLLIVVFLLCPFFARAEGGEPLVITADAFNGDDGSVATDKLIWKYRAGDDAAWAGAAFDAADWETIKGTNIPVDLLRRGDWRGRAWLRLAVDVDERAAAKSLALVGTLKGAAEIYLDGELLVRFGDPGAGEIDEYNPARLPVPFRFGRGGRHTFAVRFASDAFADANSYKAAWLTNGGVLPGFAFNIYDTGDYRQAISDYAYGSSMRVGFMFAGFLLALALIHFLLYIFYRVERANLYYSIYAAAFGVQLFFGNLIAFGHQGLFEAVVMRVVAATLISISFVALLAFLHVAFERRFGIALGLITGLWILYIVLLAVFLSSLGRFGNMSSAAIFLSFTFSIYLLVQALRQKKPGAWILFGGVLLFALGMLTVLVNQGNLLDLPGYAYFFGEVSVILAVPTAVSVFLARNFARTNRHLTVQLAEVEQLSKEKIEQERRETALRAENERRAKELEEARQLQLSMLPKKLPRIRNLQIAAYMKPASEVGGDYYDFHTGKDETLTVAVGDATGHGLRAGTLVTAAKTLFKNHADDADIPGVFKNSSRVIKEMNLRGLFMAMTMLKVKDNRAFVCAAGMPSPLVFRRATGCVEEIDLRAMPWGSPFGAAYVQTEITFGDGDAILLMSDGFPEMFDENGEMIGEAAAIAALREAAIDGSAQEIVNRLVEIGEKWAGARPADDDVTFVVLKFA